MEIAKKNDYIRHAGRGYCVKAVNDSGVWAEPSVLAPDEKHFVVNVQHGDYTITAKWKGTYEEQGISI